MAFTSICRKSAVSEGGMGIFQTGKKSVLLVWPGGGKLKAYRGRCPHADMPLSGATFNGTTITCEHHQWGFDCTRQVRDAPRPQCALAVPAARGG
jgi:toluene monooxygenase system ferredoxin subunit